MVFLFIYVKQVFCCVLGNQYLPISTTNQYLLLSSLVYSLALRTSTFNWDAKNSNPKNFIKTNCSFVSYYIITTKHYEERNNVKKLDFYSDFYTNILDFNAYRSPILAFDDRINCILSVSDVRILLKTSVHGIKHAVCNYESWWSVIGVARGLLCVSNKGICLEDISWRKDLLPTKHWRNI